MSNHPDTAPRPPRVVDWPTQLSKITDSLDLGHLYLDGEGPQAKLIPPPDATIPPEGGGAE